MSSVDEILKQLEDLSLKETRLLARLKQARKREKAAAVASTDVLWAIGQRVRIINKITHPATREADEGDRKATITSVRPGRIDIITDNGVSTWRAPKNLAALQSPQNNL